MSALDPRNVPEQATSEDLEADEANGDAPSGGGHSRWMMIACCIPMLAIAVVIALSGAGFGFLIIAVMCTAMMALMMGGMSRGGGNGGGSDAGD